MNNHLKLASCAFFTISLFPFLSGCTSMNNNFDCPLTQNGHACESVSKINDHVDQGDLGSGNKSITKSHQSLTDKSSKNEPVPTPAIGLTPYTLATEHKTGKPLRYSENVMRVWLAPFEDAQGHYYRDSEIFVVTQPGRWLDNPVSETKD